MAFLTEPRSQPIFRAPAVIWLIIAVIVGIELSREYLWLKDTDVIFAQYGFVPAHYAAAWRAAHHFHAGLFGQLLPFLSYNFLHGSLLHVGANSVWLLAFGSVVARNLGTARFLAFFFLCGVVAAGFYLALNWGSPDPAIGASGSIAGMMAAGIRMAGLNGLADRDDHVFRPLTDRLVLSFTLFWMLANLVAGLLGLGAEPGQAIAWQAHIGGYLAGLFLIGWIYQPARSGALEDEIPPPAP
ncbi:MAG TPA: rhomboid family intramembrane serine protease [Rhizomicrobium sp.]|nr:rhomboid family intramembrane serine protease [Rhizomicrobium sp.]